MQNKSEKYSAVYSRFCLRARLSEAGARTQVYGNDFRRMSGAGERDKRERNGKSGLTPDKTKRPSVGGARTGPAPPLGAGWRRPRRRRIRRRQVWLAATQ